MAYLKSISRISSNDCPTMPIHVNWQAAQILQLAGPMNVPKLPSNLVNFANRDMAGRYATSDINNNQSPRG